MIIQPTLHDIQIENIQYNHEFAIDRNLDVEINNNFFKNLINRIIFYKALYLLLLSSLIFIIYEYHETITLYLSKIANIF
jgi:hypothetical protein